MFRSGEAAFEADTYYDRMPNYSAVPIISITLINRAVSEWNVRTNVRVCTSRDLYAYATDLHVTNLLF